MIEDSKLIYKNPKSNVCVTNCFTKNLSGFGRTEEEALKSLQTALRIANGHKGINLDPSLGLLA